ncbi:MAG TPA: hypothetical protein DEW46_02380 [Verrucomicrobia bacterium]|nr:hypothetical protein [Verrucomicrobiota bacterium]
MTIDKMAGVSGPHWLRTWFLPVLVLCLLIIGLTVPLVWRSRMQPAGYERAKGYHGRGAKVGPNTFEIAAVARALGNGDVRVEDGWGGPAKASHAWQPSTLPTESGWLDGADIQILSQSRTIGPGAFDILEVRVFDGQTMELLNAGGREGIGWTWDPAGVVHVRRIGRELPPQVDVWFRVHSYVPGEPVYRWGSSEGASVGLGVGRLEVADLLPGLWSYRQTAGGVQWLSEQGDEPELSSTVVLRLDGELPEGRWQIAAVAANGEKGFPDIPHFIQASMVVGGVLVLDFPMPIERITGFELRPFGGRHRFYFRGVQLPARGGTGFPTAPVLRFQPQGRAEVELASDAWSPLDCTMSLYDGDVFSGGFGGSSGLCMNRRPEPLRVGEVSTLLIRVDGISWRDWTILLRDDEGVLLATLRPGEGTGTWLSHFRSTLVSHVVELPIEQIATVELHPGVLTDEQAADTRMSEADKY